MEDRCHQVFEIGGIPLKGVHLLASSVSRSIPTETLFARLHELFGPGLEVVGLDPLSAAQLVDGDLATESFQDNADLLF